MAACDYKKLNPARVYRTEFGPALRYAELVSYHEIEIIEIEIDHQKVLLEFYVYYSACTLYYSTCHSQNRCRPKIGADKGRWLELETLWARFARLLAALEPEPQVQTHDTRTDGHLIKASRADTS